MRWAAVSTVIRTRVGTGAGVSTTASRANGAAGWFVAGVSLVALDAGAVGIGVAEPIPRPDGAPVWLERGIPFGGSIVGLGGRATPVTSWGADDLPGWCVSGL